MQTPTLTEVVRDENKAEFEFYRQGNVYYRVSIADKPGWWIFPINLEDVAQGTLHREMKAITLMRWIRKSLADGTFVRYAIAYDKKP